MPVVIGIVAGEAVAAGIAASVVSAALSVMADVIAIVANAMIGESVVSAAIARAALTIIAHNNVTAQRKVKRPMRRRLPAVLHLQRWMAAQTPNRAKARLRAAKAGAGAAAAAEAGVNVEIAPKRHARMTAPRRKMRLAQIRKHNRLLTHRKARNPRKPARPTVAAAIVTRARPLCRVRVAMGRPMRQQRSAPAVHQHQ